MFETLPRIPDQVIYSQLCSIRRSYRVSMAVNKAGHSSPELIQPLLASTDGGAGKKRKRLTDFFLVKNTKKEEAGNEPASKLRHL